MEKKLFTLIFEGLKEPRFNSKWYCFDKRGTSLGLEDLKALNLDESMLETLEVRFADKYSAYVKVNQKTAERINNINNEMFKNYSEYYIYVTDKYLNKFIELKYNEELKVVEYKLNEEKLIEDWISKGCPKIYGDEESIEKYNNAVKAEEERVKAKEEEVKKEREERNKRLEEEKVLKEFRKKKELQWIESNGSDTLKEMVEYGLDCHNRFLYEFSSKLFDDFNSLSIMFDPLEDHVYNLNDNDAELTDEQFETYKDITEILTRYKFKHELYIVEEDDEKVCRSEYAKKYDTDYSELDLEAGDLVLYVPYLELYIKF